MTAIRVESPQMGALITARTPDGATADVVKVGIPGTLQARRRLIGRPTVTFTPMDGKPETIRLPKGEKVATFAQQQWGVASLDKKYANSTSEQLRKGIPVNKVEPTGDILIARVGEVAEKGYTSGSRSVIFYLRDAARTETIVDSSILDRQGVMSIDSQMASAAGNHLQVGESGKVERRKGQ